MLRDSIDYKGTAVGKLFRRFLFPTVMGMVFSAVFVITDGIFVGRGIGSDALAAVNLTAPLFTLGTANAAWPRSTSRSRSSYRHC